MFGKSIYLSNISNEITLEYEVEWYFTSLHISEEFDDSYKEKAIHLLNTLKKENKKIIVDLSPRALPLLDCKTLKEFAETYSVDYVRVDFGFDEKEIMEANSCCGIAVNASMKPLDCLDSLKNVIAMHNFYPRKETGLDEVYFEKRNAFYKEKGIPVGAFISGDQECRGPLYEGLPTLEKHRFLKPYVQFIDLYKKVDFVFVGDIEITPEQNQLIQNTIQTNQIYLPVKLDEEYSYLYNQSFTNRIDSPSWIIRLLESRMYATKGKIEEVKNTSDRRKGTVTIDNKNYLRYSGEVQVTKEDLPKDEKVNVIGNVVDDYLGLLDCIEGNQKFVFYKAE